MAITVIKDYSLPFAKNDDYIYLDSDKKEEQQFRYGLHYLYDENPATNVNNQIEQGFIEFDSDNDLSDIYNDGDVIYIDIFNFKLWNDVPLFIKKIQVLSSVTYRFYIDVDKLKNDSMWFYNGLVVSDAKNNDFNIYKCITKKVAANSKGYGVFSVNDISNNILDNDCLSIKFKYLPFEEYLVKLNYDRTSVISSRYNKFVTDNATTDDDILVFNEGDYVIIEGDSESFYNGVQKCILSSANTQPRFFETDKPGLKGASVSGGLVYKADYEPTVIIDNLNISTQKTTLYSGLKFEDVAGLNDVELNNLVSDYVSGDKVLSYAPREQKTYINDIGELWVGKDELLDLIVTYEVEDVDGVLHYYDYTDNDGLDVYKIPSNPVSINSKIMDNNAARGLPVVQECDKSYKILISYVNEFFKFDLLKDTKFERVRLLFSDLLGSVNGFNFALYNAKTVSTSKDTFTKDINDFSSLNTIKFNKESRGKTDVSTNVKYKLRLNSDFLTQEESNYFEDLLISNNVKMQYKGDVVAVNIPSKSVVIKEKVNGLVRYALDVEYSINRTIW